MVFENLIHYSLVVGAMKLLRIALIVVGLLNLAITARSFPLFSGNKQIGRLRRPAVLSVLTMSMFTFKNGEACRDP